MFFLFKKEKFFFIISNYKGLIFNFKRFFLYSISLNIQELILNIVNENELFFFDTNLLIQFYFKKSKITQEDLNNLNLVNNYIFYNRFIYYDFFFNSVIFDLEIKKLYKKLYLLIKYNFLYSLNSQYSINKVNSNLLLDFSQKNIISKFFLEIKILFEK